MLSGLWYTFYVTMATLRELERIPKESEDHIMDGFTTLITIIGVGTMAYLLTRFLVWLDTPKGRRNTA